MYRNQSTDLLCKSVDWFLYDNGLRHERINGRFDDESKSAKDTAFLINAEAHAGTCQRSLMKLFCGMG